MKKFLIVIDMQNDFIGGVLGSKEAIAIVPRVKKKIDEYVDRGDTIIFTQDTHQPSYRTQTKTIEEKTVPEHCVHLTRGWEIVDELDVKNIPHRDVFKSTFGYPWNHERTISDAYISGENVYIEIVGVCTDICVVSNALILRTLMPEANITVDVSCCAGTSPEAHAAALKTMKSCLINIIGEEE